MSHLLSASLFRLKLLDSLRAGDTQKVDALLAELRQVESNTGTRELIRLRETVLHFAVQIAPLATIQHLVESSSPPFDINSQDPDGNTPLHLAAAASRSNVVKYLFSLPTINDTIYNADRKQPVELARDANVAQLMQFERAKFVERAATDLRRYFSNRDFAKLEELLINNARAAELLDINGADPATGNTVLHEFIGKEDYDMCEWILKHGGDPFKRDVKGRLPIDLVLRSDPIRKLLKGATKDQSMMDPVSNSNNTLKTGNAPTYKGYLQKWTNFASGYKLRYFVLDEKGILSYYTSQSDTSNACRGSLNLGYASLHLDSSEKLKFEIYGKNGNKLHLRANHPVETNRWVWTLQNAITVAKDNIKRANSPTALSSYPADATTRISVDDSLLQTKDTDSIEKKRRFLNIPGRKKHSKTPSLVSVSSFAASEYDDTRSIASENRSLSGGKPDWPHPTDYSAEDFDHDYANSIDSDSAATDDESAVDGGSKHSKDQLYAMRRSIKIEMDSLLDLFKNLVENTNSSEQKDVFEIGLRTLTNIGDLMNQLEAVANVRDNKLLKKIERQDEVNKLWESSIRQLENEVQKQEALLNLHEAQKLRLRKLLESKGISSPQVSNEFAAGYFGPESTSDKATAAHGDTENASLINAIFNDSDDEFFDADDFEEADQAEEKKGFTSSIAGAAAGAGALGATSAAETSASKDDSKAKTEKEATSEQAEEDSKSEEGELNKAQEAKKLTLEEEGSFLGYEQPPREKLAMDEDDRPKVGLWGILKSMIGKDMTKMTLPVSFNEPTSLLQRLVEDVEYNLLLNEAATIEDSTLRIVYVTAFAASEYASTINRIAKPFNPLLGETFEYSRPEQQFRLITEQVSHHPPISACHAESIKWDYYGENAVDSQFRGRSFDFKHLGKMFCVVRPDKGVVNRKGEKVEEELYSWKKVNTSVVGIITGNPTVDNYGKMEVRNHTTGDVMMVDLKQRGWKSSSAYQLSGVVEDAKGNIQWAIGGRWNSKIYARKVSEVPDKTRRDSLVDANTDNSLDPYNGKAFLVWSAAPRPKVPFNLTSFAITLNEINDQVRPWLAPTDTRLRPDQRAMEDGRYDDASREKNRVEEKQRAARRKREASKQPYKPNWFVKLKHPVTGDGYWHYNSQYWPRRKEHKLEGTGDIF